jgi:hypothetical protein
MLRWEFEHHAHQARQSWEWRALRSDGRVYRRSKRPFTSFLGAFDDASRHGFDRHRHDWSLATPTYHPADGRFVSYTKQRGRLVRKKAVAPFRNG